MIRVARAVALALLLSGCSGGDEPRILGAEGAPAVGPAATTTTEAPPPTYGTDPYAGLGTWVDVFDFSPRFAGEVGPRVTPAHVEAMAAAGVETIYLQAARHEHDVPGGIPDPDVVAGFLEEAHARGIEVVAWYLPRTYGDDDLARLAALRDFRAGQHAFDGLAVDIEWRKDVADLGERNQRLVEFSQRLRGDMHGAAIGAIVLPPVLLEVVNTDYWPAFPWRKIAPYYDVWLPMSYWTDRSWASGYQDPYVYTDETVRRLRANLGQPEALVHVVGGIGDGIAADNYATLGRAVREHGAMGVSIYDWVTTAPNHRDRLREALG